MLFQFLGFKNLLGEGFPDPNNLIRVENFVKAGLLLLL